MGLVVCIVAHCIEWSAVQLVCQAPASETAGTHPAHGCTLQADHGMQCQFGSETIQLKAESIIYVLTCVVEVKPLMLAAGVHESFRMLHSDYL